MIVWQKKLSKLSNVYIDLTRRVLYIRRERCKYPCCGELSDATSIPLHNNLHPNWNTNWSFFLWNNRLLLSAVHWVATILEEFHSLIYFFLFVSGLSLCSCNAWQGNTRGWGSATGNNFLLFIIVDIFLLGTISYVSYNRRFNLSTRSKYKRYTKYLSSFKINKKCFLGCQVFKFATQESQGALGIIPANQSMPVSLSFFLKNNCHLHLFPHNIFFETFWKFNCIKIYSHS